MLDVRCNQYRVRVDIVETAGKRAILVDGREIPCDWIRLPDGRYSILIAGKVFDLSAECHQDSCTVTGRDGTRTLEVRDPRCLFSSRTAAEGPSGLQRLQAEMPGKVLRVLVKEGDAVVQDQGLLVLEAMKMQNEIRAPKAGIVREIGAREGKSAKTGDFLISLE